MEKTVCSTCGKSKAQLTCGLCESTICKYCTQFLDDETFSFLKVIPPLLSHTTYCGYCFDAQVGPELEAYNKTKELAKSILVFTKDQKKETRLVKRVEDPVSVENCLDREETLLRLAFFAAKANYNAIIDVDLKPEKIRQGAYQTMKWSGSGVPAHVIESKLLRDKAFSHNPN